MTGGDSDCTHRTRRKVELAQTLESRLRDQGRPREAQIIAELRRSHAAAVAQLRRELEAVRDLTREINEAQLITDRLRAVLAELDEEPAITLAEHVELFPKLGEHLPRTAAVVRQQAAHRPTGLEAHFKETRDAVQPTASAPRSAPPPKPKR